MENIEGFYGAIPNFLVHLVSLNFGRKSPHLNLLRLSDDQLQSLRLNKKCLSMVRNESPALSSKVAVAQSNFHAYYICMYLQLLQ